MKYKFYQLIVTLLSFGAILEAKIEKRMAVIIPSYHNAQWYKKNLDSLFDQNYQNWHAIYVDDCSSDGTAQLVKDYLHECGMELKVQIIANKERKGALANHYIATHMCDDFDIVVQLDGDDWFAHNGVLSLLNDAYEDPNVWLTYGSFEDWPTGVRGYSKPTPQKTIDQRLYRETYWTPGQLRTFYAWIFKKIKLEDLLWDHDDAAHGKFYPASYDLAIGYPMMEMIGSHFKFISDLIYIHNVQTPINDFKINRISQIITSNILLYKNKYELIKNPPISTKKAFKGIDVIIFSDNGFETCQKTIDSCVKYIDSLARIFVVDLFSTSIGEYKKGSFVGIAHHEGIKSLLVKSLYDWKKSSEHVLFMHNGMRCVDKIKSQEIVNVIDNAQAFGFFPSLSILNPTVSPCAHLQNGYYVWRLCYADQSWLTGDNKFCLFAKKELIRERITYLNDNLIYESLLKDLFAPGMLFIKDSTISRIGFAFTHPKVVAQ